MDFTFVQRSHVEQALADLAAGVSLPGFRDSTTYDVVHQGRPFPPKLLIALALKLPEIDVHVLWEYLTPPKADG